MSKINLQRGKLTVENRKSREKKRICSEVSVNSPGNPWSQSISPLAYIFSPRLHSIPREFPEFSMFREIPE